MKKIALLCPTLKRPERKMQMLSSIINTVADPKNITLFMGIDSEGDDTLGIMKQASKSISFLQVVELGKECKGKIHACWNALAKKAYNANYDVLGMFADDFVCQTYGWDEKILDEFSGDKLPPDKWKLVTVNDLHQEGRIPVNYFVHNYYYDLMGYIATERYIINWCDNHIKCHFTPFGRYVYRSDIVIEHRHWVFSGNGPDEVGREMVAREGGSKALSDDLWPTGEPGRVDDVLKIAKATNLKPNFRCGDFSEKYWNL